MVTPTVVNKGGTVVTVTLAPSTTFNPGATVLPSGWYSKDFGGFVVITTTNPLTPNTPIDLPIVVDVAPGVLPGTSLQFTGVTSSSTSDPDVTNNTANADTSVIANADLDVSKTATPTTVLAGQLVTYTIVVTNLGPSFASFVDIKDTLPAGVTQVGEATITRSKGSDPIACSGGICQATRVEDGEVVTMTVVGRVGAGVQDGVRLTNTATVFSPSDVVSTTNNADSAGVLVNRAVKLTVTKSSTPSPTVPGGGLTYVIVVSNEGPSDAAFVTMTDNLPDGFAVISVNGTLGGVCNTSDPVSCSWATLPAGQSATVTIVGSVAASQTAALTNTAQVTTTTTITGNSQLSATITTPVSPSADLALAVGSTPTVFGGESLVVTPTVVNNGPSYAQNTVVTVTLAPSTTFNPGATVLPSGWYSKDFGGFVVITTSVPLTPNTPIDLPIVVDVAPGVLPGTSLQFNGVTSSSTADPDATNNTANADTSVIANADLDVSKTATPTTVIAGELVTYTIVVTNLGPSFASFVDLKDTLPAGVTQVGEATITRSKGTTPSRAAAGSARRRASRTAKW